MVFVMPFLAVAGRAMPSLSTHGLYIAAAAGRDMQIRRGSGADAFGGPTPGAAANGRIRSTQQHGVISMWRKQ